MNTDNQIPEPILFSPLKHHLGFMREYISLKTEGDYNSDCKVLLKEMKHLGKSVMDVYTGSLSIFGICKEVKGFLDQTGIEKFSHWVGKKINDFKIISLSDGSQWTLKYLDNDLRFVHIFPSRRSKYTFRVKSNTLKSALIYFAIIGKDFITCDDLNMARRLLYLSPVKNIADTEAITETIEILRGI